jgi:hypothetical protein
MALGAAVREENPSPTASALTYPEVSALSGFPAIAACG